MDCLSQSDNEVDPESGFGLTLSVPKLDSIVTVWSSAKPREEDGVDSRAFRDLQELLDEPTPSGSKESLDISSSSKSTLRLSSVKRSRKESRSGDSRMYSYDEIIECQEKLNDSAEFQFCLDDADREGILSLQKHVQIEYFYIYIFFS